MEVSIIKNYELVGNYNFSIAQNKRLYSLTVLQLALLDLGMLKKGVIRLVANFNSWYGVNLMSLGITGIQVLVGAIILAYLFNIEILQKKNWKDILLSIIITLGLIIITVL